LILEETDPMVRMEYVLEPFPREPGGWPTLAARIAEGFRLVAPCFQMNGVILSRPENADPVAGIGEDRFRLISGWGKRKKTAKLDAACREGFRLISAVRVMHWPPFSLLLEKTAAPGQDYEYRLPKHWSDLAVLNELGKGGFHAHRMNPWIMERDVAAKTVYQYQRLKAPSTAELAKGMESMVGEGWDFVCFCPGPDTMLLERSQPAQE
jgi:hypothetical protein